MSQESEDLPDMTTSNVIESDESELTSTQVEQKFFIMLDTADSDTYYHNVENWRQCIDAAKKDFTLKCKMANELIQWYQPLPRPDLEDFDQSLELEGIMEDFFNYLDLIVKRDEMGRFSFQLKN